jgi:hypothetical protein
MPSLGDPAGRIGSPQSTGDFDRSQYRNAVPAYIGTQNFTQRGRTMKTNRRRSYHPQQAENMGSLDAASVFFPGAASWVRYLTRVQEETFYFLHACSSRAGETMKRFASCRKFEDIVDAQAALVGDLLSDFAEEGALMASLLCEQTAQATGTGARAGTR